MRRTHPGKALWFLLSSILAPIAIVISSAAADDNSKHLVGVWNSFLDQTNVLECTNLGTGSVSFTLALRNSTGEEIGRRGLLLGGEETSHFILNEFNLGVGYGLFTIETAAGEKANLRCLTAFYRFAPPAQGVPIEYAFAVAAVEPAAGETAGIFNSHNPDGTGEPVYNWLSLVNLDSAALFSAQLVIYDQSGGVAGARDIALHPGERKDFALGHEDGYRVGVYRVLPQSGASYSAFLTRYSRDEGQGYRFAFAVPSRSPSSEPGPISVSTMGNALNYAEIANAGQKRLEVALDIRDQFGQSKEQRSLLLEPFSQIHTLVNPYLGVDAVGSLEARCLNCETGEGILVQSMFYGRGAGGRVKWAYGSTGSILPAAQVKIAAPVNTFLKAANWEKLLGTKGRPWFKNRLAGASGTIKTERAYQLPEGGEVDVGLHEDAGPDFAGAAFGELDGDGENPRIELLRVYPDVDGSIGYIMNVPVFYLAAPVPEPPVDQPSCLPLFQAQGPDGGGQTADITSHFAVSASDEQTALDRSSRSLTSTVLLTIKNVVQQPISGPLHLAISGLGSCVGMPGALGSLGQPPYNTYYFDLASTADDVFSPGEEKKVALTFIRPDYFLLRYQVSLFGPPNGQTGNRPPVILVRPLEQNVSQGGRAVLQVSATDPDGDPVAIGASPKIPQASFQAVSGVNASATFTFSPSQTEKGKYLVSFTARDPQGAQDVETAQISVTGTNRAPELSVPGPQAVNEGQLLTFHVEAADADGDLPLISAAPVPERAVFIPASGTFSFAPDYTQQGQYEVVFTANDGALNSPPKSVKINVLNVEPGQGTQPTELVLEVDDPQNPTLLSGTRITGAVNSGAGLPRPPVPVSALVNELSPAQAEQGAVLDVRLISSDPAYPAHFAAGASQVSFGAGITVNSIAVTSATELAANISIDKSAALGSRSVVVQTGNETAVSLFAFRVIRGRVIITGTLQDPDTNTPLGGAAIGIQGTGIHVVSNADGTFTLFDVPAGPLILTINAPNHQFFTLEVDGAAGGTLGLGSIGSPATVFDPAAPAAASLVSVIGRGAARSISLLTKEELRQLIIDTLIFTGGDEGGVLDEYGNQLNPLVSGEGLISVTLKGVDVLADRLLKDENYALVDLLFSVAYGYQWKGSLGRPLTLDELLAVIQQQASAAWADPMNPENAFALVVFNSGAAMLPNPPVIDRTTRLNALQMYLLASSLFIDMQWRLDNQHVFAAPQQNAVKRMLAQFDDFLVPNAVAQVRPPGRYTRFWRGGFNNSYPETLLKQGAQVLAETAALFALLPSGGLAGANFGSHVAGRFSSDMMAMMMALQTALRVPDAPKLLGYTRTSAGVVFTYDPVDPASNVFTLLRFDTPTAKPLIVDMTVLRELTPKEKRAGMVIDPTHVVDRNPPGSGSVYYAMTGTWGRYNENTISEAGLARSAITPWWGAGMAPGAEGNTRADYFAYWLSQQSVIYTSEYSIPLIYIADPLPHLEAINSIAVDAKTDEVYVNEPPAARISRITKKYGKLDEQVFFANTGFPAPGAQGLAIASGPVLYSDNSASDAQFGGRIFKWNKAGQREFTGTMNYFSQILMFANPVSVGPMVIAPDGGLYAFERLSRDVRRIPVGAAYDPNRRTGQFFARIPDDGRGTLIDMDVVTAQAPQGAIYMLDARGISAVQLPTKKQAAASLGRFKIE